MIGYKALETAVVTKFLSHFSTELNAARCRAGDMDGVFDSIFTENVDYGCFFEFNGGGQKPLPAQTKNHWVWSIIGAFVIRFKDEPDIAGDDIETKLRNIVDRMATVFDSDRTLAGSTPLVEVVEIGRAEPVKVNDVAFYWVPFGIDIFDR